MNLPKKARSNSLLKRLPEERQAAIMEWLQTKSLAEVRDLLAREGIEVDRGILSRFRQWWLLREQHQQNAVQVRELLKLLPQEKSELSEEAVFQYGQQVFALLAMQQEDPQQWIRIQRLRQQEGQLSLHAQRTQTFGRRADLAEGALKLAREKFECDVAKAALAQLPALRKIASANLLNSKEKIDQVRMAVFGCAPP
jgi:hypothetical protein